MTDTQPRTDGVRNKIWSRADMQKPELLSLRAGDAVAFTHGCPDWDRQNQDALALVTGEAGAVLAICDGAGGQPAGDKAAEVALTTLSREVVNSMGGKTPVREGVLSGFECANRAVVDLGVGAKTTMVAVEIHDRKMRTYHTGDSRILVCGQRGRIKLLSVAHSPVGYAVEAGLLGENEALHHEELHIVSNLVGDSAMSVEVGSELTLSVRDTLLIATDGVFDNLSPEEVVDEVRSGPLEDAVLRLVHSVWARMSAPSHDRRPSKPDDIGIIAFRPRLPLRGA